ncbi:MAG: SCO family protein [Bryobacteraceae bacterium]|nr:SCO family protein [Bryobacteraceae bacterium]
MDRRAWLAAASSALLAGCLKAPLPEINQVPDFELVDQDGRPFRSADRLRGRIWVADFFFTTCNGPCPRMSALMRRVQDATAEFDNVRLVSFTVDPKTDTPAVLKEYGRRFRQNPERWFLLTGDPETLRHLAARVFFLGGMGPEHGTRFALVDRKMRLRGYYETTDSSCVGQVVGDIRRLRREIL